jgi:hypothetical protein
VLLGRPNDNKGATAQNTCDKNFHYEAKNRVEAPNRLYPGPSHGRSAVLLDEGRTRVLTLVFVFPQMTTKPLFLIPILYVAATVAVANPSENKTSAITSHIPRQRVQSSALASIGYSKRLHILEIEFVNGAIYRYDQVPLSVYRDLMSADSKARYYDANIKGHYHSVRVRPRKSENR